MTSQTIEQKVRELISAKFSVDLTTISGETRLVEDLRVDSFGAVELMFEIEEALDLSIPDSDIEHVRSVNDIVAYVVAWKEKHRDP